MKYCLEIRVSLKSGHSDSEGETTTRSLRELGYSAACVSVSKVYTIVLEVSSAKEAEAKADEMCRKLLANPTKDDYSIAVEEQR